MPGSITPLPVMLEEADRAIYEKLEAPKSIVVRYGYQKMIAELPYGGDAKPGCGSKLVIRSPRGTEIGEMLTTTCDNSGCSKSVSRQEMLRYIENSGGKDYPFTTEGRVLRVATVEDLNEQSRIDLYKPEYIKTAKRFIRELGLGMELVEVELLLGNEKVLFFYKAEQWVDFRELVKLLAGELQTRIEMVQVSDREEARLVADYEKCGQHCCCKQFLKVLKPVSMRSAKVQKATLDPQKISGRCGRLMCCLRYEDKTYSQLKKNLPHRKSIVETEDGIGVVLDTQILTQLALVRIGQTPPAAYPVENIRLLDKDEARAWQEEENKRLEELAAGRAARGPQRPRSPRPWERPKPRHEEPPTQDEQAEPTGEATPSRGEAPSSGYSGAAGAGAAGESGGKPKRRRRRRGRGGSGEGGGDLGQGAGPHDRASGDGGGASGSAEDTSGSGGEPRRPQPGQPLGDDEVQSKEGGNSAELPDVSSGYNNPRLEGDASAGGGGGGKKRRRRRRRRGGGGDGGGGGGESGGE